MGKKTLIYILLIVLVLGGLGYWSARKYVNTAVLTKLVEQDGFEGTYFAKAATENSVGVVILGNLDWAEYWAQQFADSGLIAFNLNYRSAPELDNRRWGIPLESFEAGISWFSSQPRVNPEKVVIFGESHQGGYALQVAAYYPDLIKGAAVYSPASINFSGIENPQVRQDKSAFTRNGEEIPFISMERLQPEKGRINALSYWKSAMAIADSSQKAHIPVEKINGPLLLLSGKDDAIWPATAMADAIAARRKANNTPFKDLNLQYENAGHLLSAHPEMPTDTRGGKMTVGAEDFDFKFGGTEEGDKAAQIAAKKALFEFLRNL